MIFWNRLIKSSTIHGTSRLNTGCKDERTKDAILRNIQIIGEASKHIPDEIVMKYPDIDWSGISGMRDIITHRYFRVDWHLLWTSIHDELPLLKSQVQKLIKIHR